MADNFKSLYRDQIGYGGVSDEPFKACMAPAPDASGRTCDRPLGHGGDHLGHWTYGSGELRWGQDDAAARDCEKRGGGSLSDLPRYLRVNGHRVIGDLAEEHLTKVASVRASLTAVLHQLEHGEASDAIDRRDEDVGSWQDAAADLRWCRDQIREALKSLS